MSKVGSKFNDTQRQDVISQVSAMYLSGKSQNKIAEIIGIDQSQISRYLKALRKIWLENSVKNFDEAKSAELAKIDNLEQRAWSAFDSTENFRFMEIVGTCIDRRIKMFGFNAPIKQEIAGNLLAQFVNVRMEDV